MKFKEFRTGLIDLNVNFAIRLFEDNCAEYKTMSFDIVNNGTNSMVIQGFGGWDSLSQKLYSNVYSQIVLAIDFQNNLSAEYQNNLAIRMRRFENISSSIPPGTIAASSTGTISTLVDDCQIFWCNGFRPSGTGTVEAMGIFKSGIEGISDFFEVTSGGTTATPWIDCRAYGSMGFEVLNTGSTTFTSLRVETRRHPSGSSTITPYGGTSFASANPISRFQRTRLYPSTASAASPGGKQVTDFNIDEAHSIRFSVVPAGAFTVRGILKG